MNFVIALRDENGVEVDETRERRYCRRVFMVSNGNIKSLLTTPAEPAASWYSPTDKERRGDDIGARSTEDSTAAIVDDTD
mmetsp:Transcript_8515/g.15420  ORF Transcript_8515/g.15420 Transcript_8515/m.15420 type:complete len:80 (+) Transcript_8515:1927-2166(+)